MRWAAGTAHPAPGTQHAVRGHPARCPRRVLAVPAGRRGGRRGRHYPAAEESQGEVRAVRAVRARGPALIGPGVPAAQRYEGGAGRGRAAPAPGSAPGAPRGEQAGHHLHLQHGEQPREKEKRLSLVRVASVEPERCVSLPDGERGLHAGTAGQCE